MTQQQWDKHTEHLTGHITWPATKKQILEACNGEDVDKKVLDDVGMNLPDGNYENMAKVEEILVN